MFKYLLFAGDEYDGEHTESFCDGGGGDADIWFVACPAFSAPLHRKKVGNIFMVLQTTCRKNVQWQWL